MNQISPYLNGLLARADPYPLPVKYLPSSGLMVQGKQFYANTIPDSEDFNSEESSSEQGKHSSKSFLQDLVDRKILAPLNFRLIKPQSGLPDLPPLDQPSIKAIVRSFDVMVP
jgi:hypothetical protein